MERVIDGEDFRGQVGASSLLGTIGGLLHRVAEILDVRPVIGGEHGSHEIVAMDVTTAHGKFRVSVRPVDQDIDGARSS